MRESNAVSYEQLLKDIRNRFNNYRKHLEYKYRIIFKQIIWWVWITVILSNYIELEVGSYFIHIVY